MYDEVDSTSPWSTERSPEGASSLNSSCTCAYKTIVPYVLPLLHVPSPLSTHTGSGPPVPEARGEEGIHPPINFPSIPCAINSSERLNVTTVFPSVPSDVLPSPCPLGRQFTASGGCKQLIRLSSTVRFASEKSPLMSYVPGLSWMVMVGLYVASVYQRNPSEMVACVTRSLKAK